MKRIDKATWLWLVIILLVFIIIIPYCRKHWDDGVPLPPEAPEKS